MRAPASTARRLARPLCAASAPLCPRRPLGPQQRGITGACSSRLPVCCSPTTSSATGRPRALATAPSSPATARPASVTVRGQSFETDPAWFNVPASVLEATSRRLHLQKDHPVCITRQILQSSFPGPTYKYHNDLHPVVSVQQNFDSLGFPEAHPGRAVSDTYYVNRDTLLRTHTSAHQADTFRADESAGYLVSADVYRRDAVDRSHYPVFHQMEGARSWDRSTVPRGDVAAAVREDIARLATHDIVVQDPNPPFHDERNPRQAEHHSAAEAEAISHHLKRSLECMVVDIFSRARAAAVRGDADFVDEPLQMRWVEAFFPFTSPSWELEVFYAGDWLEVLGCGVVKQDLYINAGVPSKLGWAFGIGLDRIAMLLFRIPDIRLFWSRDERFLSQFRGVSDRLDALKLFVPFSKYPPCPKDVSFWLPATSSPASAAAAGGNVKRGATFHENDVMELVRNVAGDRVEDVRLIDEFAHPKTGRRSMAYRIVYRSLERTLTNEETNQLHEDVRRALVRQLGVELR